MADSGGTSLASHYVIVREVTRGLEADDSGATGEDRMQRAHLFADGWIDDEHTMRTGILIDDKIAHLVPVGTLPKALYLRCKATGNELHGLVITEINLGGLTPLSFGWSGTPPDGGSKVGKHKMPADGNKIIEAVDCTVGGPGASCTVAVILHSDTDSTISTVNVTSSGLHRDDELFKAFSHDDYLTVDISNAVGDADDEMDLTVKVICRERTGI